MLIASIALGGCLKGAPVEYGLTEDTGGHITYVLGAGAALATRDDVDRVEIFTRLIDDPVLGAAYAVPQERLGPKLAIRRFDTGNRRYLAKEDNVADRPAFRDALMRHLAEAPCRPDLIHAHFADAGDVAIAVRERFGIPFVYTAHSLAIDKRDTSAIDAVGIAARIAEEDRIIAAADAIIASSRDEAERQLMLYPSACASRIHRIAPGAALVPRGRPDAARARALVAPFLRDVDKPIVLAIARPVAKKNLAGLIDLFAGDPELRGKANLVIVAGLREGPDSGEPEQRTVIASLLERLDRHDLYGSLALPKRHDQDDVRALYAWARSTGGVFVNPALTEPYGLTLTEAAMHGVPVVATCHGGAADIVAELGHGVVADPRDPASFAAAIRGLIGDRAAWRRASLAGRENSRALTWDGYAARFAALARPLVSPRMPTTVRPHRLLLCDIDNTLTGCRDGARDFGRFLTAEPALAFGVATGRSLQEATRLVREWGYPEPGVLITSVGTEIYWRHGDRLSPDRDYAETIAAGWDAAEVERRMSAVAGVVSQPDVEQRRFKRSYFAGTATAVAAARAALAGMTVRIVHSHGNLLDILPERAGKGAAMAWAAWRLGIPRERVYAAGDSGNDLDMLARCRNPILVANHSAELAPLLSSPAIYLARRGYAGGIVEGMRAFAEREAA